MANKIDVFDLGEAINIKHIENGYVFGKNGSVTVGFKVTMPEVNTLTREDIIKDEDEIGRNLHSLLAGAINTLEIGYTFHQQDITYFDKSPIRDAANYTGLSIKRMYHEKEFMQIATFFFVTMPHINISNAESIEKGLQKFKSIIQPFLINIEVFQPVKMTDSDWLEYYTNFCSCDFSVNGDNDSKVLLDLNFPKSTFGDKELLGYQTIGDVSVEDYKGYQKNSVRSDVELTRYNCKVYPVVYGVNCYKIVNNIIRKANVDEIVKEMGHIAGRLGFAGLGSSAEAQASEGMIEYLKFAVNAEAKDIIPYSEVPVYHKFSAFFIYPQEESAKIREQVGRAFKQMELKPSQIHLNLEHHLLSTFGGCVQRLQKFSDLNPLLLNEAVAFCNVENKATQSYEGTVLGDTEGGVVVADFVFTPVKAGWITNNNAVIVGPSGSGKSVTMNKFLSSWRERRFLTLMVDIGNSYRTQTLLQNSEKHNSAKFYTMDGNGTNLSFNPFLLPLVNPNDLPEDLTETFHADIEVLVMLIIQAWDPRRELKDPSGHNPLNNINSRALLTKMLLAFYRKRYDERVEYVNFTSIYNFMINEWWNDITTDEQGLISLISFKLVMERYTESGEYARFFNGKTNVFDIKDIELIVFELEKAADREELYRLTLAIIIILAKQIVNKASSYRFAYLVIDEAWRLLADEFFGVVIKNLYKTIRKKGAGIIIIVQDFDDILKSDFSSAILNNSSTKIVLRHLEKRNELDKHATTLSLTPQQLSMVKSLQQHEIFVMLGNKGSVYKVGLSPEELLIYSTTSNVTSVRDKVIEYCDNNVPMAIDKMIAETNNFQS